MDTFLNTLVELPQEFGETTLLVLEVHHLNAISLLSFK